jgi:hypothetical protein
MPFDIALAFDKAKYLDPQIYLFASSIKDKIPKDTVFHIVTNRNREDEPLQYLLSNLNCVSILYQNDEYPDLSSRCRYMLNAFKINPNNPWVIKMELDFVFLKHLSAFEELIQSNKDSDIIIESENRLITNDMRLWRNIYKAMGIKCPIDITIEYRENKERGFPLFGTGLFIVKSNLLDKINERWVPLTKICEKWGEFNIHPNESGITGLIFDEGWKWTIYDDKYKYNPIGHHRDGPWPSPKLKDNSILPENTILLDYHKFEWLQHMAKYNKNVKDEIGNLLDNVDINITKQRDNGF